MAAETSGPYVMKVGTSPGQRTTTLVDSTEKFIRMILLIMIYSPRLPGLVAIIQNLPEATQHVVGVVMREVAPKSVQEEGEMQSGSGYGTGEDSLRGAFPPSPDPRLEILLLEEKYAQIRSELDSVRRESDLKEIELQAVSQDLARSQETNVSYVQS